MSYQSTQYSAAGAYTAGNQAKQQAKHYQRQKIETASPEEILILLYEGAIRFLVLAKRALPEKDIQTFHNNLIKTQNIILEFMSSLDMDLGGETAANLFNLYEYLNYRLIQANMKKDEGMIDEVLNHLRQLKSTWEEAIKISHQEREVLRKESEADFIDVESEERSYSV